MKRILFIGQVWPEPTSSAAGWRMLQLVKLFQQEYEVYFASSATRSEYSHDLGALGIIECEILLNDTSFDRLIVDIQPDIVIFDRFMTEEQYSWRIRRSCPDTLLILDTEDLHLLREARLQAYKKNTPVDVYNTIALREIAAIYRSDLSLIISESEIKLLREAFNIHDRLLHYLPFQEEVIDTEHIRNLLPFENREGFVFIGNFLHEPNWRTVELLKCDIWPMVRKALPQAQLHIYGAYVPDKAKQLHHEKSGFFIRGRAEDARATLEKYRVLLAPIPIGAGIKGKFVDAMYAGTPSVSSTIGAEGMENRGLWNGYIEDDATDFVKAAVTLFTDRDVWMQSQHQGFELFNQRFANHLAASTLLEKCKYLSDYLEQHRRENFIGMMLQHHSLQSTKYMSLWIEEKNKSAH